MLMKRETGRLTDKVEYKDSRRALLFLFGA